MRVICSLPGFQGSRCLQAAQALFQHLLSASVSSAWGCCGRGGAPRLQNKPSEPGRNAQGRLQCQEGSLASIICRRLSRRPSQTRPRLSIRWSHIDVRIYHTWKCQIAHQLSEPALMRGATEQHQQLQFLPDPSETSSCQEALWMAIIQGTCTA